MPAHLVMVTRLPVSQSPSLPVSVGVQPRILHATRQLFAGRLGGALEAPTQYLLNRSDIVRARDSLDFELAVAVLLRLAVLEHHHRANRVGALGVRNVVALDPRRQACQPK